MDTILPQFALILPQLVTNFFLNKLLIYMTKETSGEEFVTFVTKFVTIKMLVYIAYSLKVTKLQIFSNFTPYYSVKKYTDLYIGK